jgi:hypothetical protein
MTMELDKMKDIWQSGDIPKDQNFNKEKVMKNIQNRVKHLYIDDKWQFLGIGIVFLFLSLLGIVIQKLSDSPFFWMFPPAAVLFAYQFYVFSKADLHAQPIPVYITNALRRVRAKRITNILLAVIFISVNLLSFIRDEFVLSEWDISSIIGLGAFMLLAVLLFSTILWYQKRFHAGSLSDLEKDLKRLKREMKDEGLTIDE